MKFPYLKIPAKEPGKKWISRPIIPVTLFGPKGSVTVDALIDSGADRCLFHTDLGREIGLELEKGEKEIFGGIEGGRIPAFRHKIQIQIVGMGEKIEVLAGFAAAPGIFAILGQEGFFDAFRIKFEKDYNVFEITLA